ncbi:unnamed protein product [Rotaria sp. Silwood1]|nr:unnamed protein product [Rotaria sp. Silwood1]CAF1555127.1 unnamed protein product [Rotaria sp. Silwood1]CAF3686338.1 unnamed protein product [Rotaria sp. Silwood1]CAF4915736.1 unnamed protein product [Rotaria sp. Silwood1]
MKANVSIQLYNRYKNNESALEAARQKLVERKQSPSPTRLCGYQYENVCLAGYFLQKCTCGKPALAE